MSINNYYHWVHNEGEVCLELCVWRRDFKIKMIESGSEPRLGDACVYSDG